LAHDIFISYSHKDKPIADAICTNLETSGVRCWIAPRDIGPGEDWPTAIAREIPQSRVMVMIFSSNSNTSDQVYRELFLAANNNVIIIPFKIEDVKPNPRTGYILAGTHWLDALNPPTQEQINILVKCVKSFLANPDVIKPVQVTPSLPGSSNLEHARRIPVWAWGILITILILAGGAASVTLWGQTHKATPLDSQPPYPTNTPGIAATQSSGPQSEQARAFAEPILAVIAERKPDFADDFSSINSDWRFCGDSPGTSTVEDGVARFRISQGHTCMWNDKGLTGKDFILQFDARLVSGDTTSQINVGLHNVSNNHHFWLSLSPAIQTWDITRQWGINDYPTLASGENAVSPVGETTYMTIITRGSRFALYLNQTAAGYFDNEKFDNAGQTFIHCTSVSPAVCEFDNVKFWNLTDIPGLP
jgi:hypothetical protein